MPPGMQGHMDDNIQQQLRMDGEDETSMSLFRFQEEKKSLCRNTVDEEVVFETDEQTGKGGSVSRTNSGEDARSTTSTTSIMNSWCFMDDDEKKEELLAAKQVAHEQEPGALDVARSQDTEEEEKKPERRIQHVDPESAVLVASAPRSQSTPTSSKASPSLRSNSKSPPSLLSPDQQQLLAMARGREDKRKATQQGKKAKLDSRVTNVPNQVTGEAREKPSPKQNNGPVQRNAQQGDARLSPARSRSQSTEEGGAGSSPRPSTNNDAAPSSKPKQDASTASPPRPRMDANDKLKTAATSPPRNRMDANDKPNTAAAAAKPRENKGSVSPPRVRKDSNTASPTRPGLSANTMGLTRQKSSLHLNVPRCSAEDDKPASSPRGDPYGLGLTRQVGMHDLKPPKLPVQDSVPERDPNTMVLDNLDLKRSSHHGAAKMMDQKPAAAALGRQGGKHNLKQPPTQDPASHLSGGAQGNLISRRTQQGHTEAPLISDSQLRALYQNPVPTSDHGKLPHGPVHTEAPGKGMPRPTGLLHSSHHSSNKHTGGVPTTVRIGPIQRGIRAKAPRGPQWKGPPVSAETLQYAQTANRMQRQQRLKQKKQSEQQLQHQLMQMKLRKGQQQQALVQKQQHEGGAKTGGSDKDEDDLDMSNLGSDDLGDDSILCSQSFALASKVLNRNQRRPSDCSLDPEIGGKGGVRRRQSIMVKDVSADPAFNAFVSEPKASITPRSIPAAPKTAALAEIRRGLHRNRSKQVMQSTAALQQSYRSGLSSVTMDSAAVQEAVDKVQDRPGLGRSQFSRGLGFNEVTLDNPYSGHSSIGYNSASNRTLDVSAHLNASSGLDIGYQSYNSQLQPHLEGDSVSTANQSKTALDATSAVSPPTREEMRRRRASVKAQPQPQGGRMPSKRRSLQDGRVPADATSVASSRISAAPMQRRTSRTSNTSVAGLRQRSSVKTSDGKDSGPVRLGSTPGEVAIPVPRGMDPRRFATRLKEEREKEANEVWDGILNDQNDIIMQLACELSKLDNEKQVQAQQQLHLHVQKDRVSAAPPPSGQDGMVTIGSTEETPLALQDKRGPDHLQGLFDHSPAATANRTGPTTKSDSIDAALMIALEESRKASQSTPAREPEPIDPALRLALEASKQECEPTPIGENESVDHALFVAIEESKKDSRPQPTLDNDNDRALEIALEMSRVEAKESDSIRNARQLYSELGESLPAVEPEKSVPRAPLEPVIAQPSDAEVAKTLEVAMRLSKETYEYEVSKRQQLGQHNIRHIKLGPSSSVSPDNQDPVLEYSVSTQNDDLGRLPRAGNSVGHNESPPDHSLVMPSELLEEDESVRRGSLAPSSHIAEGDGHDVGEALSLAMALSKMEPAASAGNANNLSQEESLAYALELSRRAPGAHDSMESSNSRPRPQPQQPRSSTESYPEYASAQQVYQEPRTPQHQFPHALPCQQGYSQLPYHPQLYQQQPYYPPPYQPPLYQPLPYQMPPCQPHLYPPHPYPPPVYPQFYQQPYQQAVYPPPPQPFSDNRSVGSYPLASVLPQPSDPSFDNPSASSSFPYSPVASDDDEALKLALAMSREDDNRRRETANPGSAATASTADDLSLALALELSRRDGYR